MEENILIIMVNPLTVLFVLREMDVVRAKKNYGGVIAHFQLILVLL